MVNLTPMDVLDRQASNFYDGLCVCVCVCAFYVLMCTQCPFILKFSDVSAVFKASGDKSIISLLFFHKLVSFRAGA